jgi:hypothetical protein
MYPLGAELFPADRQTDRHDEAIRRFSHFLQTYRKLINYVSVMTGNISKTREEPAP